MKVLYLAHSENIEGSGIALINILKGMSQFEVECVVVVPQPGAMKIEVEKLGLPCYVSMCHNAIYPRRKYFLDYILWPYRFVRTLVVNHLAKVRLEKIVKIEKPDIIHSNTGVIRFGCDVAEMFDIPHVWHVREFQSKDFFWVPLGGEKKVIKLYHRPNNHCIAITRAVFDYFALNIDKDQVVYDGVFPNNYQGLATDVKQNYFLYVGQLEKGKGIFDALHAFESFSKEYPNYELWLAGRDYVGVQNIISKSVCKSQIKYLGFRRDIYSLMSSAIALLVPSYYEGFGLITAEAMINKTIVIGRDVAGTKEQFDNGVRLTGHEIGLRFIEVDDITSAMKKVIDGTIDCKAIIDRAYESVRELYTIEHNVDEIYRLYNKILK